MKRLPWSVTCLSPTQPRCEPLATQNPDGSLVFSAVLKDEQRLLSFLLVPPSLKRTPRRQCNAAQDLSSSGISTDRRFDSLQSNPDKIRDPPT